MTFEEELRRKAIIAEFVRVNNDMFERMPMDNAEKIFLFCSSMISILKQTGTKEATLRYIKGLKNVVEEHYD